MYIIIVCGVKRKREQNKTQRIQMEMFHIYAQFYFVFILLLTSHIFRALQRAGGKTKTMRQDFVEKGAPRPSASPTNRFLLFIECVILRNVNRSILKSNSLTSFIQNLIQFQKKCTFCISFRVLCDFVGNKNLHFMVTGMQGQDRIQR